MAIFIYDKKFLLANLRIYSKSLSQVISLKDNTVDYQELMNYLERINKKNSFSKKLRILKKENSNLDIDIVLEIKKTYKNSEGIQVIYLKKC